MNDSRNKWIRILSLLLALCLLLPAVAAAAKPWQYTKTPFGAKVKAGTIFYTDAELTTEQGTLLMDAAVVVQEVWIRAARIAYTVKEKTEEAWVAGEDLIMLNLATPTDLDALIVNENVVLLAPAVPAEANEPAAEPVKEPEEKPAEAENLPVEEAPEEPLEESVSAEEPAANPAEESGAEPDQETAEKPAAEAAGEAAEDPVREENKETEPKPEEKPAGEPEQEPVVAETAFGSLEEEEVRETITEAELQGLSRGTAPEDETSVFAAEGNRLVAQSYQQPVSTLPAVRNQNPYNTCWAFAAVGAMEIDLIKDGKTPIDLSEFFLAYFSAHNYPYPKAGGEEDSATYTGSGSYLDNGGHSTLAYHILASLIGTTSESDNPYPGRDEEDLLPAAYTSIAAQITGAYSMSAADATSLKKQIQEHGSVKVSIYMPYSGNYDRIIAVEDGRIGYSSSTAALYGTYTKTNHDVLLVGWDDNFARDNFVPDLAPAGKGAWKARNSWGSDFGEGGYFWISYEDASLKSGKAVAFDADIQNISDYCYSYDKSYSPTQNVSVRDQAVVKQAFTVGAQELLQSVGIEITGGNVTLSARVLANGAEVAASNSVTAEHSGFYLLKLKQPYLITANTAVEVEVTCKANTTGGEVIIPYQFDGVKNLGSIRFEAGVDGGGFTLNGTNVDGDSSIKLYTKRNPSSGLVSGITLNQTKITGLQTADTCQLTAAVTPANAANPTLKWYSSDNAVAYLDGDGLVVGGEKSGTAVITAMSSNGKYASCTVEVTGRKVPLRTVKIHGYDSHSFRIDDSSESGIKMGDRIALKAELTPKYASDAITWKTSNNSVISILNQKGNTCEICIRKNGTARITVSSVANDAISDWVEFTVDLTTRVTSVSLDQNMLSLWEGQDAQLRATVTPANADDQRLIWSSDKPEVAEVTQTGYVTAKKDGTAVITVTTRDGGYSASCVVLVASQNPIESFVYRMYRVCLLREPDPAGLQTWIDQLESGKKTGAEIAYQFYNSVEMRKRNLSDEDFVERCYEGLMGRPSDAGGKLTWVRKLEGGMSRKAIISGFARSREYGEICSHYGIRQGEYNSDEARDRNSGVTGFVSRLYTKMLGREYDSEGLNHWCTRILDNPTKDNVLTVALNGFMLSREFTEKNLSDMEFVKVLYRTFLGREFDEGGLTHWVGKLASGMSRVQVASGFAHSSEFSGIMASYGL